jgi:hypothetical protein
MKFDNKIDTMLATPARILSFVPLGMGIGMAFIPFLLFQIFGPVLFLLTFIALTIQERVTVDLEKKKYRQYLYLLGISIGKWYTLPDFKSITIINTGKSYREANFAVNNPPQLRVPIVNFFSGAVELNLKIDNFKRVKIAKGNYKKITKLAYAISKLTDKKVLDFTSGKMIELN